MPRTQIWYESEDGVDHEVDKKIKKIASSFGSTKVKAEYWKAPGYRYLTFTFRDEIDAEQFGDTVHDRIGGMIEWEIL